MNMQIRKIQLEDLKSRVEWMNNPAVYSNMHFDIPITLENTVKWFNKNLNDDCRIDFAIEHDSRLVGFGGLTNIDKSVGKAEFYIFINPHEHSRGFGSKALIKILEYAFDTLSLNRVWLVTDAGNTVARKMYEKCGLSLEGILRQDALRNQKLIDRCRYAMLRSEFNKKIKEV